MTKFVKIYAIVQPSIPFAYLTVGKAIEALPGLIECDVTTMDVSLLEQGKLIADDGADVVFVCESSHISHRELTTKYIRRFYPHAKLVMIGSDTLFFTRQGKNQINDIRDVSLYLDSTYEVVEHYQKMGVPTDYWQWTASGWLIDYVSKFQSITKLWDCIGVYAPWTITREGSYRQKMVKYIRDSGLSFTTGGGSGHEDQDCDKIYQAYSQSICCVGTTSHDNPTIRTGKGYRDAIAPFMDSLLLYDDHPDILKFYPNCVPTYDYNNWQDLVYLVKYYKKHEDERQALLELQRSWVKENLIELQLVKLFKKYGII